MISDILMPEMNGLDLAADIRKHDPKIKIIFISGYYNLAPFRDRVNQEAQRYGYRTLDKPFKPSLLLDMIREYLNDDLGERQGLETFA